MTIRNDWGAEVSAQEVFDHVVAHLHEQGVRAAKLMPDGDVDHCMYRDDEGRACAVGALLSEEEASRIGAARQAKSVLSLSELGLLPARLCPYVGNIRGVGLLGELQSLHDTRPDLRSYDVARSLRVVAAKFNLSPASVDRIYGTATGSAAAAEVVQ
jgi:hypothetical protein